MDLDIRKLQGRMYRDGVDRLKRAYEAAAASFDEEFTRIQEDHDELQAKVEAGEAQWSVTDEDGDVSYDYGEELGERQFEAENNLITLRKAFAIMAYHHWERSAQRWFTYTVEKPNHGDFVRALKGAGHAIDEAALSELNLLVNCLKHDSADSGPRLYRKRPDLFEVDFVVNPLHPVTGEPRRRKLWADHIALTDAHLRRFIEVVRASAPK